MIGALLGLLASFLLVVVLIALWARGRFQQAGTRDEREQLLVQAARAAGDDSARELLLLLRMLEAADPGQAVTIGWHARRTVKDATPGFLIKIAWDGNEWRRAQPATEVRARIEARLAEDPSLAGPMAQQLLADVRAAEA